MNLLLDEDASGKALVEALDEIGDLNITTVKNCGLLGKGDDVIVKEAHNRNKVLLTANYHDLNEENQPPCGHGGLIVFKENHLKPDYVVPRIKALKTLSLMKKVKSHVTKIYDEGVEVYTLQEVIRKGFKDHAKTKKLIK